MGRSWFVYLRMVLGRIRLAISTKYATWKLEGAWIIFTILVVLVQRRHGVAAVGANVVETIISRVKTVLPNMIGLLVALLVGLTVFSVQMGGFVVNDYIQATVIVVSNSLLTSIIVGGLDDATQ